LGVDYQLGRVHISRQRDRRILHDADVEAVLLQDVIDTPPAGAVHEASVDKNDIVDLRHYASLRINRLMISSNFVDCKTGRSAGFLALEYMPGIDAGLAERTAEIGCVAHEAAGRDEFAIAVDGRHFMADRQGGELRTVYLP